MAMARQNGKQSSSWRAQRIAHAGSKRKSERESGGDGGSVARSGKRQNIMTSMAADKRNNGVA